MSKKKKIIIVTAILSCIIIAFIGGQSFSKYVSEIKGYGTAQIATWDFKVNGLTQESQSIDLGSTCNNATLTGNKIAPGTRGSFNINLDAGNSDVGINYLIKFVEESQKPQNLKFIYNNKQYYSVTELGDTLSGIINANDENRTRTFTIEWEWPYQTGTNEEEIKKNDTVDTENARNITNYSFNVVISGVQVAPQP